MKIQIRLGNWVVFGRRQNLSEQINVNGIQREGSRVDSFFKDFVAVSKKQYKISTEMERKEFRARMRWKSQEREK